MSNNFLSRPVLIHCCKDRTLSYRTKDEPIFNGRAIPVFSVNNKEEAEALIMAVGTLQYERHSLMPGRAWRKINIGFKRHLELEDLTEVTKKLQSVYESSINKSEEK